MINKGSQLWRILEKRGNWYYFGICNKRGEEIIVYT